MEPLAKFVGRSQFLEPGIERSGSFGQTARPQPIDKHTSAIAGRRLIVYALESDRHTRCILTLTETQRRSCGATNLIVREKPFRPRFSRLAAGSLALLALALLIGCDSEPRKTDAELGLTPQQAQGRRVYEARCADCHYAYSTHDLRGPSLHGLFKKQFMTNGIPANDERVTDIILMGRSKMPAFQQKLTQEQFADLMVYLHTL